MCLHCIRLIVMGITDVQKMNQCFLNRWQYQTLLKVQVRDQRPKAAHVTTFTIPRELKFTSLNFQSKTVRGIFSIRMSILRCFVKFLAPGFFLNFNLSFPLSLSLSLSLLLSLSLTASAILLNVEFFLGSRFFAGPEQHLNCPLKQRFFCCYLL